MQLGSRSSQCHAAIYDRRGPTRVELRFRHELAEYVRSLLLRLGLLPTARQALATFIEQCDVEPIPRLIAGQAALTVPPRERPDTLAHAIAWFKRQHGTTLRLLVEELKIPVKSLMRREELSSKQLQMVERWKQERKRSSMLW